MANTLITPTVIAREVLDRLYETTVMANLIHRDYEGDFTGKQGDTITVRQPAQFTANTFVRATGITVQNATEASFTVSLDTLLDVSFNVTAEELTLKIDDFSNRLLAPAAEALAQKVDTSILTGMVAGAGSTVGVDGTPSTNPTLLVDAHKVLNDNKVPKADRFAILTTTVAANYKKDALFVQAHQSGSTDGLREASLGRKFGFDLYETTNLPAGGDGVAAHRTAYALVTRTLETPLGVSPSQVATVDYKGLGVRVVQSYDITKKQDVVSIDLLCGFKLLDAARAVKILG